jgi:hypothetical protein
VNLNDRFWQALSKARHDGLVITAGRRDNMIRMISAVRSEHVETALRMRGHALHSDAFAQRGVDRFGEAAEIIENFVLHHEAVRIGPSIRPAGQVALPIRRHEAEAVPPAFVPYMKRTMFFEHEMLDGARLQMITDG